MPGILDSVARQLWPDAEPEQPARRWLLGTGRYLFALIRDLATGELNLRAMSLVYTTILAIVPTLGFAFATAKGLGYDSQLGTYLTTLLEPLGESGETITNEVVGFVENIDGGVLGVLSIGLLLVTVIMMTQKVESSFNFVWRVDRPRSLLRRFSEYLSVILIGPLLISLVLTLIAGIDPIGSWISAVNRILPALVTIALFAFLYVFVPNTRVKLRPALIGGLAGGLVWVMIGFGFTDLVLSSARLQSIYSGFAIMLILMFWLYLSWLILLLGAQLAFYVQYPYHLRFGQRTAPIDNDSRERLSLAIMYLIARDFAEPAHGWTNESLAAKLCIPRHALEPIMAALDAARLVVRTSDERLMPGRDPHRIRLTDILASVRGDAAHWSTVRESWNAQVDAIADCIDTAIRDELGERTLGHLIDDTGPDGAR